MRFFISILAILCISAACRANPKNATVYVGVDMGSGVSAGGTGTVIAAENGKSLVLTNAHVVESDKYPITVTYTWTDGQSYISPATYIAGSSVSHLDSTTIHTNGPDLAILEVGFELPMADIAVAPPPPGTPVTIYGFGGVNNAITPATKTGKIIGDAGFIEPAIKHTIYTVNGDSGAGIFDPKGELVAVHWGGAAVTLDVVKEFTATAIKTKRPIFPRLFNRLTSKKLPVPKDNTKRPIPWRDL